jgi:Fe-S-cluster containining protein
MANSDSTTPEAAGPDAGLRDDLERGLRFMHTLGMQSKVDLVDLSARVFALIEELVSSQTLDLRAFDNRREAIARREAERMTREGHVRVMGDPTEDKYALSDLPQVDCEARFPLCRARCCTLSFSLSFQDLNERIVQWDYGLPYHIRQGADGYCVHNDRATGGCGVYEHRPAICRSYTCRNDTRIWKDFEGRIPADLDQGQSTPEAGGTA